MKERWVYQVCKMIKVAAHKTGEVYSTYKRSLTVSEGESLLLLGHELLLDVFPPQPVLLHRLTALVDLLLARLRLAHPILQLELPVVTLDVPLYVLRVKI